MVDVKIAENIKKERRTHKQGNEKVSKREVRETKDNYKLRDRLASRAWFRFGM